jgi:hypothetical protein
VSEGCERAAPAGHESQLAYGSLVFAAGGIPHPRHRYPISRITRPQQSDPGLQTPLDLRCVRHPVAYGLHQDRTASLQLYQDGTWYCYGACHAGGSVFDFASRVWSTGTKGQEFLRLRARLAAELGLG